MIQNFTQSHNPLTMIFAPVGCISQHLHTDIKTHGCVISRRRFVVWLSSTSNTKRARCTTMIRKRSRVYHVNTDTLSANDCRASARSVSSWSGARERSRNYVYWTTNKTRDKRTVREQDDESCGCAMLSSGTRAMVMGSEHGLSCLSLDRPVLRRSGRRSRVLTSCRSAAADTEFTFRRAGVAESSNTPLLALSAHPDIQRALIVLWLLKRDNDTRMKQSELWVKTVHCLYILLPPLSVLTARRVCMRAVRHAWTRTYDMYSSYSLPRLYKRESQLLFRSH